ncbi:MAG: hypothetical protein JNJ40_19010 [Bacteroidia bacterium]|nr:hypothetical protein [Bacteroidia bacterium]
MRVCAKISLLLFFFHVSKAQDKVKRFEFGPTLVTVNSLNKTYYSGSDRQSIEISSGLLFKYLKKKMAFRSLIGYNECHLKYYAPTGWIDATRGETNNKDFRFGLGIQHNFLRTKEWLYGFTDLSYRNVYSSGFIYGGIVGYHNSFYSSTNGLDGIIGLGLKLKLFDDIFILPEVGYNTSFGNVHYTTTHLISNETNKYSYSEVNANLIAKLHLTVRF